eukprot:TRINITY_DN983_c0_g2_i1.p1 TRINITY_DN983_c0_g2~~TRINITY_DN983_c0_g2_i1.p1  ORF type:complete len:428 (+),score=163.40 TRINITY_DN983_c0_g2_i1:183-1286(+)
MWDPDAMEPEYVPPTWRGNVDVRGGAELKELLMKYNHTLLHADFEQAIKDERQRLLTSPYKAADPSTFYQDYRTYQEIHQHLEAMSQNFVNVSLLSIGNTNNGNPIHAIRFGNLESQHVVWVQCGIHAREWIAPMTCMYFSQKLLEQRTNDPLLVRLFADTQIYMTPVLNRDGYEYTWNQERMWRKNRQPNEGSSYVGTDLNRNWDSAWGGCGASTAPSSDTYRGTGPFSATEAAVVRDFIAKLKNEGKHILGGHDFHAYGNLLLRPHGWTSTPSDNDQIEGARGQKMVDAIRSTTGQVYQNIKAYDLYCCSGLAVDWIADQTTENSGFTFELRGTSFVLPPDQIVPSGEEIYRAMVVWLQEVLYIM